MESCVIRFESRVKQFLEHLLAKNQVEIDVECLEKFLSQLWQQEARKVESTLQILPLLTQWVSRAVATWTANGVTPPTSVASFTMGLTSLLSKKEERFCGFNNDNVFIQLISVLKVNQDEVAPSVQLSYIKLLLSFLEHTSGMKCLIACSFWEDVFQLSVAPQSGEVVRESTEFMAKLIERAVDYDEGFCNFIVQRVMRHLGDKIDAWMEVSSETGPNDELTSYYLKSTLRMIGDVLSHLLKRIYLDQKDFRVILIFLKHLHLEERVAAFFLTESSCTIFEYRKIGFIIEFLELYVKSVTNCISMNDVNVSVLQIKERFFENFRKGSFEDAMEYCTFGFLYWNLMHSKVSFHKTGDDIAFLNRMCLLLTVPNVCLLIKFCFAPRLLELEELEDDFRGFFNQRLCSMLSSRSFRAFYFWRDPLMNRPDLFEVCTQSLHCISVSRKYFSKDSAVVLFQSLIYNLKDLMKVIKESPEKLDIFVNELCYFLQLLELLGNLIEEFHITWKDSLEVLDVMALAFDFLTLRKWTTCIVLESLKLINIATAKYMSPNLALLVEDSADSTITLLGPLLQNKVRDEIPEVKKAALEVTCTMARMSSSKFPSLQKVLMDSELPTLVVKMSTCDGESFVRATAIKCLQEMIQVEEIWNNALKTEDLPQKMRDILINETEGIVRVEAATFMCVAYEHQQFPKDTLDGVYETMIYSSTTDLHWEVKVRALGFWDKVIKNHLQNQGMIDGSFPNVTFSKEHRKIVTLTDSEIRKRLLKVLSQLSSIGCLGVLMSAIKDDCDMEVSKTAVKITQRLVELFKNYNVNSDCSAPTSPLPTESGAMSMSSGISVDDSMDSPASGPPDFNEDIIEQIVNSKDMCLLKNVYAPSDYGSVSNYDIQVRRIVTPNEFLQFTQQDLNSIITEKKNWLNGIEDLGSLLDDMLKTYEDDVNNMDCY